MNAPRSNIQATAVTEGPNLEHSARHRLAPSAAPKELLRYWLMSGRPGKLLEMSQPLTANDLLPLVARLEPQERQRLIQLIAATSERDASIYRATPPVQGEFSTDEASLGWDAEGWEEFA